VARNNIVGRLVAGAPPHPVVLDVGCGRGLTVDFLRKAGVDCHGVELADVQPLPDVRPFVFTSQDVFALPEDLRRRVTVLLLLDVVEHLPAPEAFLAACVLHFPSLSRLIVTVPARAELWSNYDDFYGHVRRYDRASLQALIRPVASRSPAAGYFFHALYPVMRAQLAVASERPLAHQAPRWQWPHRVAARLFDLEERLLPARWYGTSLWGVADR
jgi:methyltransferase family protein